MKQRCLAILLVLLSLLAIFYPLISNRINEKYRSEVRTAYYESIASLDNGGIPAKPTENITYSVGSATPRLLPY